MDLESENSALESTGDNDLACYANRLSGDDVKIRLNGSSLHDDDENGNPPPYLRSVEIKEDANTNQLNSEELDATVTKGKGLRKWRRIRREVTRDNHINLDTDKLLKRGLAKMGNSIEVAAEMKQKSEGSVSSTNAVVNNPVSTGSYSNAGSSSVYRVEGVSRFSIGADSDNSEDRSSKSSTAASVPKSRHDQLRGKSGYSVEKHKAKHTGRKQIVSSTIWKKPRGGAFDVDKENSLSSLESDSRNYGSVYMQGSSSAMINGHSDRLNSDDEQDGEEASQVEAAVLWQVPETVKNRTLLGNEDPLVDCVQMLQSVRETLQQEIRNFGELGKEALRPLDQVDISNSAITELLRAEQLKETTAMLNEAESRITKLESTINEMKSSNGNLRRSINAQQSKYMEMESEMEILFTQKTEAEIKFTVIFDKIITAENQMQLQKSQEPNETVLRTDETDEGLPVQKIQSRVIEYSFIQVILFVFVFVCFVLRLWPKSEVVRPT